MSGTKSFDISFFPEEINFWYDTATTLHGHWRSLVHIPDLPPVNEKLDPRVVALIPALNNAMTEICLNISRGTQACWKFAEGLTEAAIHYGMTEAEAEALARDWGRK